MSKYVGKSIKRVEDPRFIQGQGKYVANLALPGMAFVAIKRSPYAHANIISIDASAALAMDGVVAVLFVVALGMYLLAQAVAVWRCWGTYLYERAIGVAVIAVLVAAWDGAAKDVVLVSTIVLIATMSAEYLRFRARIRGEVPDPQTQQHA